MVWLSAHVSAAGFRNPEGGKKAPSDRTVHVVPPSVVITTRPEVAMTPTCSRSTGLTPTPWAFPRRLTPGKCVAWVPMTVQVMPPSLVLYTCLLELVKKTLPVGSAVGVGVSTGVKNRPSPMRGGGERSQFAARSGTCWVRLRRVLLL